MDAWQARCQKLAPLQAAAGPARTREITRLSHEVRERLDPDNEELISLRAILDG